MTDLRLAPLRVLWVTLPFTLGPLLAAALEPRARGFRATVSTVSWFAWGVVLLACLIPRVESLTFVRVVVPSAAPAAIWASFVHELDWRAALGVAASVALTIAVLAAPVGDAFVNGSSYGDERRMPLRPPGLLVLGPIELAWVVGVTGFAAGPLLLASEHWVAGTVVALLGVVVAAIAVRALHQLSRRWLVFVPAGFVIHDHLALAEPVLFRRADVVSLAVAPAGTTATDLTAGSLGIALEADLASPVRITPARRAPTLEQVDVERVLFAPTRPGAALAEARRRRLPVQ
ncbi:MAG TPA: hypothetical protein VGQ20_04370 [Acidimicrobiales bacterium]|nr:hypothetical protein [Acidimicrobiales bacterium]